MSDDLLDRLSRLAPSIDDDLALASLARQRRPSMAKASTAVIALLSLLAAGVTVFQIRSEPDEAVIAGGSTTTATSTMAPGLETQPRPSQEGRVGGSWEMLPLSPLQPRDGEASVGTGQLVFIWGGRGEPGSGAGRLKDSFEDGAVYNVEDKTWTVLPRAPIPGRQHAAAVWTGSEVIVWGGMSGGACGTAGDGLSSGATFNPDSMSWRQITDAPFRGCWSGGRAVWTGTEMLAWGGDHMELGAAYNPRTDSWRRIAGHRLITTNLLWTGRSVIGEGAEYLVESDRWRKIPPAPIFEPGELVWTGSEVLAWGSEGEGAAYEPTTGSWRRLPPAPVVNRVNKAVAWTGREMVVWAGLAKEGRGLGPILDSTYLADGARYDVQQDRWLPVSPSPLSARSGTTSVWTDRGLFIWGGFGPPKSTRLNDGAILLRTEP